MQVDQMEGFLQWLKGEESSCQCRRGRRCGFYPLIRKIPWRRKWQPSPVFLPGKSHGQRTRVGYSLWGHKRAGHGPSAKHQQQMEDYKVMRKVTVAQSCPTLWDSMDCSPPGSSVHEFSRQEYWTGLPFPPPGDLPDPGIESEYPALQADS